MATTTSTKTTTVMKKWQAVDRWACFACRWSAKHPRRRADDVAPQPCCPHCSQPMRYVGKAFRAPAADDVEGWGVAERLRAMGVWFGSTSDRRRLPRTWRELAEWTPDVAPFAPEGSVRIDDDGVVSISGRVLADREAVLVWRQGWQAGSLRLTGDGRLTLPRPVVIVGPHVVVVERGLRLRARP